MPLMRRYRKLEFGHQLARLGGSRLVEGKARPSRNSGWRNARRISGTLARWAAAVCALFPVGCGVGGLVGGAVAAVVTSVDDGSSSPPPTAPTVALSVAPSRETLRALGDPFLVPVCFDVLAASDDTDVVAEFSTELDDFSLWRPATPRSQAVPPPPCGTDVFWWDAARDVETTDRTYAVRVRLRIPSVPESTTAESEAFTIGNSIPEVQFIDTADVESDISIVIRARDGEADPLEEARLYYRVPGSDDVEIGACGDVASGGEDGYDDSACTASELIRRCLEPPLPTRLEAPPTTLIYSGEWDSRSATGCHNVDGLIFRLVYRDAFGHVGEVASTPILVRNNRIPEARFVGSPQELDQSFEVPVPFRVFDPDGHDLDVVIQYAPLGESFPELSTDFLDPEFRRSVLTTFNPAASELRAQYRIATPSRRRNNTTAGVIALRADARGVHHYFLWDSAFDVGIGSRTAARLRITPFDEELGVAAEIETDLVLDNDVLPSDARLEGIETRVSGSAIGDLDGDGRADLAVALPEAVAPSPYPTCAEILGRVDLFFRTSDGSLAETPSITLTSGSTCTPQPIDVQLADFNEDDALDLAVLDKNCSPDSTCTVNGSVSIFLNRGPEAAVPFELQPDYVLTAHDDVHSLTVADFDERAGLDVAVSSARDQKISAFFRRPGGGFEERVDVETPGGRPTDMSVADFNGDGRVELAVVVDNPGGQDTVDLIRWSYGTQPNWALWARVDVNRPSCISTGDLNGDQKPDLAVCEDDAIKVFINASTRDDVNFVRNGELGVELGVSGAQLIATDVLGNGRPQLLVVEPSLDRIEIAHADGDVFKRIQTTLRTGGIDTPVSATVGDLDGDGWPDVIVGGLRGAWLLRSEHPGSLSTRFRQSFAAEGEGFFQDLLLRDFDGDGRRDLALATTDSIRASYKVLLFHQDRLGGLRTIPGRRLESRVAATQASMFQPFVVLASGDRDNDSADDILALSREGGVDVFVRPHDGEFPETPTTSLEDDLAAGPLLLGHFSAEDQLNLVRLDRNGRLLLLDLTIDETAGPTLTFAVRESIELDSQPVSVAAGDLNLDGLQDLVLLRSPSQIEIFVQTPRSETPRFGLRQSVATPAGPATVGLASLNADSTSDILLASRLSGAILGFCPTIIPEGSGIFVDPDAVDVADDDAVLAMDDADAVLVRLEVGDNAPAAPPESTPAPESTPDSTPDPTPGPSGGDELHQCLELAVGSQPIDVVVSDLSGDGRPDIAVTLRDGERVELFFQRPDGTYTARPSRALELDAGPSGQIRIAAADITGDSRADLVVVRPLANEIRIVRGR